MMEAKQEDNDNKNRDLHVISEWIHGTGLDYRRQPTNRAYAEAVFEDILYSDNPKITLSLQSIALEYLLMRGCPPDLDDRDAPHIMSTERDYDSLLTFKSASGDATCVELLLRHKANVNLIIGSSETALDVAERRGHTKVMELLQQHGGNTYENVVLLGLNKS